MVNKFAIVTVLLIAALALSNVEATSRNVPACDSISCRLNFRPDNCWFAGCGWCVAHPVTGLGVCSGPEGPPSSSS